MSSHRPPVAEFETVYRAWPAWTRQAFLAWARRWAAAPRRVFWELDLETFTWRLV